VKPLPGARAPLPDRLLLAAAVLLNAFLLGVGIYFQLHPRDRRDVWSAGGVAAVAILNTAALVVGWRDPSRRVAARLRRIALLANSVLAATGVVFAVVEALRELGHGAIHGVSLVAPPLVTMLALRRGRDRSL